jgi:phospholipid/cholesterol/gamma-HCH transport system permease protein
MKSNFLAEFGKYILMLQHAIARPENVRMYWRETLRQMHDIGVGSLIIIGVISVFIGAVTALQFAYQLDTSFVPHYYIGYIVRDSAIIELAPTISCLVLAGKVGSNMASEIGGMRQKEQIDALEVMGINTAGYLILPKLIGAIIVIPFLVIISACIGMVGGYMGSVFTHMITHTEYMFGLRQFFLPYNVFMMLVKAIVFAFILTSVSCFKGYYVTGGSIELGHASTQAVVYSNIVILLADFVIALLLT